MEQDPVIGRLVPDPSEVPDVRVLRGLVGKSSRPGSWRLYLDAELGQYFEFDEKDVLHSEELRTADHPLWGTVVWLKREANVRRTQATTREAQADFLQGRINTRLRRHSPQARLPVAIAGVPFDPSFHFYSICDELAAPSFLQGGDVFCGGSWQCVANTWDAECQ